MKDLAEVLSLLFRSFETFDSWLHVLLHRSLPQQVGVTLNHLLIACLRPLRDSLEYLGSLWTDVAVPRIEHFRPVVEL